MRNLMRFALIAPLACMMLLAQNPASQAGGSGNAGSGVTVAPPQRAPAIIHERHGKNATSTNWSGYAVTGAPGSVTEVKGTWQVPKVYCTGTSFNGTASFWVGIDGYASKTVEQIGTDSACTSGTESYSAWYEFYPHWPVTINLNTKIQAGDFVTAEVLYDKKQFTLKLWVNNTDTAPPSFSVSQRMPNADQSSAEWIAEAPSSGGVLPLANFGTASFTKCFATVSGITQANVKRVDANSIGAYGDNAVRIDMVSTTNSAALKAKTSSLSSDGTDFTINWVSPGP